MMKFIWNLFARRLPSIALEFDHTDGRPELCVSENDIMVYRHKDKRPGASRTSSSAGSDGEVLALLLHKTAEEKELDALDEKRLAEKQELERLRHEIESSIECYYTWEEHGPMLAIVLSNDPTDPVAAASECMRSNDLLLEDIKQDIERYVAKISENLDELDQSRAGHAQRKLDKLPLFERAKSHMALLEQMYSKRYADDERMIKKKHYLRSRKDSLMV
jgi:hypothetical protein